MTPKITDEKPANWKELQVQVARILRECGFDVQEPHLIQSPRGDVEVDVFAKEKLYGRQNTIICECKYWKRKTPQTVIHAFRTVIVESGANTGYVISTNGFQKGAQAAVRCTNIKLVTWDEFLRDFEDTWLRIYWPGQTLRLLELMIFFADEDYEDEVAKVADSDKSQLRELYERYFGFAFFVKGQWSAAKDNPTSRKKDCLPLAKLPYELESFTPEIINATCYKSFLSAQRKFAIAGVRELHDILSRNNCPQAPLLAQRLTDA